MAMLLSWWLLCDTVTSVTLLKNIVCKLILVLTELLDDFQSAFF